MSSRRTNIKILTVSSKSTYHFLLYQILYNEYTMPKRNSNCYIKKKHVYNEPKLTE